MPDKQFGQSIRRLRKERGWTQDELAARIGTSKQVVSTYELGKRTPHIAVAQKYADIFGVALEEMLDVYQYDDRLEALHQNPKLRILFERARRMPEKDIDFLLKMTDYIEKENYPE